MARSHRATQRVAGLGLTAKLSYLALALVVAGPLLASGQVLVVDLSLPPHPHVPLAYWGLPEGTHGGPLARLPLDAAFAALGTVDAVALGEKAVLVAAVFLAGLGMHRLVRVESRAAAAFAGVLYAVNPFVYDRLDTGQWFLLLGYALIPYAYLALLRTLAGEPWAAWRFGALFAATGVASTHMASLLLALFAITLVAWAVGKPGRRRRVLAALGALSLGVLLSLYWLIPTPQLTDFWGHIGGAQLALYSTVPDPHLGLAPTVAALSGYWNNDVPLRDHLAAWPLFALTLVLLAGIGLALRRRDPIAWAVASAGLLGFLLALGSASAVTRGPFIFLLDHVAPARSFREPQKGVALVAFAYAFLGAAAVDALVRTGTGRGRIAIAVIFLALPLMNGYRVLWGLWGDLHTSTFPVSWAQASTELEHRASASRTLFLPWHGYLELAFAGHRVVGDPAPAFFATPILASRSVGEGPGIADTSDPTDARVRRVLASGAHAGPFSACLAPLGVQYVLLAKEADWRQYGFLDRRADVRVVRRWPDLVLYRLTTRAGVVMAGPRRRGQCNEDLAPVPVSRKSPSRYRLRGAPPARSRLVVGLDQPHSWRLRGRDVVFTPWGGYRRNYLLGLAGTVLFAISLVVRRRRHPNAAAMSDAGTAPSRTIDHVPARS